MRDFLATILLIPATSLGWLAVSIATPTFRHRLYYDIVESMRRKLQRERKGPRQAAFYVEHGTVTQYDRTV